MSDALRIPDTLGRDILGLASYESPEREYRIKRYDFRRPDKFSRDQIRAVQRIHENFARLARVSLSAKLRQPWELYVESVDQMTYEEFVASINCPTFLALTSMAPLKGPALLHLDEDIVPALLERLLGGRGEGAQALGREMSHLEFPAMEKALNLLLAALRESWAELVELRPALTAIETNPRFCQIVPPSEMILIISLRVSIGDSNGLINLVLPYLTIEPLVNRLTTRYWYSAIKRETDSIKGDGLAYSYRLKAPAEVVIEGPRLSLFDLASLAPGSLVALPGSERGEAVLRLGGKDIHGLRAMGKTKNGKLLFKVLPGQGPEAPLAARDGEGEGMRGAMAELAKGVEAMRASFAQGLSSLGAELSSMRGRQEDIEDRMAYGQLEDAGSEPESKPFAALSCASEDAIAALLKDETAQMVALVLSQLDDALASRVLDAMPDPFQTQVIERIASMGWILPEVMGSLSRALEKKIDIDAKDRRVSGGVAKVVGILNLASRATEKNVIESLSLSEPDLAEEVKKAMFVFEDISLLDDAALREVVKEADRTDLLSAMKPVSEQLRERIFARFDPAQARALRTEYDRLGKVRLSESDAAGQRIVALVRSLEEEGRIVILREEA